MKDTIFLKSYETSEISHWAAKETEPIAEVQRCQGVHLAQGAAEWRERQVLLATLSQDLHHQFQPISATTSVL